MADLGPDRLAQALGSHPKANPYAEVQAQKDALLNPFREYGRESQAPGAALYRALMGFEQPKPPRPAQNREEIIAFDAANQPQSGLSAFGAALMGKPRPPGYMEASISNRKGAGLSAARLPVKEWENAGWITPEGKLLEYIDEHARMAEDAGETVESLLEQGYAKLHPYAGQLTVGGKKLTQQQKNVLQAIGRLDPSAPVTWELENAYGEGLADLLKQQ